MSTWTEIRQRMSGRWQIPLLGVSLLLLAWGLLRVTPTPRHWSSERVVEHVDGLIAAHLYPEAAEVARVALEHPSREPGDAAEIHLRRGRALYGLGMQRPGLRHQIGTLVIDALHSAAEGDAQLTAADEISLSRAYEWRGLLVPAVGAIERALRMGVESAPDHRRRYIELYARTADADNQRIHDELEQLLSELPSERVDLRLWAVDRVVHLLRGGNRAAEATTLLARERANFVGTPEEDLFEFLWALVLSTEQPEEAERLLRALRNGAQVPSDLHALTGWLLGRVTMSDTTPQRPLEAVAFFEDVLQSRPYGALAAASHLGRGEALALLQEDHESLESYRRAVSALLESGESPYVSKEQVRDSLMGMAAACQLDGRLHAAVEYTAVAASLVSPDTLEERSAVLHVLADLRDSYARSLRGERDARQEEDPDGARAKEREAREQLLQAAEEMLEVARINTLNDGLAAESGWRAGELLSTAGAPRRAAGIFERFARERPEDALVPRALLHLGTLRQALGDPTGAVEAYEECHSRFPNTIDAAHALLPLARCQLALTPDDPTAAEGTLRWILDDPVLFTPEASEFREALAMLADLKHRRGAWEEAISILDEWVARYGGDLVGDTTTERVRFLLADSYRRSALAMKEELKNPEYRGDATYQREEIDRRLLRARTLYRALSAELQGQDDPYASPLTAMYRRHARVFEADCLFERGTYAEALRSYEEIAGAYQGTETVLAAFVQIINCHVFLGQLHDARAALARAQVLVGAIPDGAFDPSLSPETRPDWERYFRWLGESELLEVTAQEITR
jgi:tetratricopeptide (TPR) repeat protein